MKLNKFIAAILVSFLVSPVMAEDVKPAETTAKKSIPPKTLFDIKNTNWSWSAYGAPFVVYSKIGDANGCLAGGRGGVIINDHVVLGLSGAGMTYPNEREKISGPGYSGIFNRIGFGYGGFLAEYYFNPKDLVVFSTGAVIGSGGVGVHNDNNESVQADHDKVRGNSFFVAEPEVNVFIHLTQFCRIGAGASYRYTRGINFDGLTDKDFSGPSARLMAQFGWF